MSFSSGDLSFRRQFTLNAYSGQADMYAQEVWSLFQFSDVFAHSNGELKAFSFVRSNADPTRLQTIRHTDRATWRQVFDLRDMNGNAVTNHATMHSDPFVPPQTVVFPHAQNLDNAPVSLSDADSALIAFDTFSRDDPNKVYRCVYAISVEPNPPSTFYDSSESESHESRGLLSPGLTELDSGNTEPDSHGSEDHLPGSDEQGLDDVGSMRSNQTPDQEEETNDEYSVDYGENHQMESFPYDDGSMLHHVSPESDAADGDRNSLGSHSASIGAYHHEAPPAAESSSANDAPLEGGSSIVASNSHAPDAGPSLLSEAANVPVPAAVASTPGTIGVAPHLPLDTLPPAPPSVPPSLVAARHGQGSSTDVRSNYNPLSGFVKKKRNQPASARHRQCDKQRFCTFQRGHGGFCNKQGRCPVKYCSQTHNHDGPCDKKLHPAYDPNFDDDDDY
jgi:hypothetical protein